MKLEIRSGLYLKLSEVQVLSTNQLCTSTASCFQIKQCQLENETPEHLQELYERTGKDLSLNERDKIKELLLKYREIFAKHDLDLGCLKGVQHKINTGNASPAKQKMRRTPYGFEKEFSPVSDTI